MQKFGFVFPGQGSQQLGMLSELASYSHIVQKTFDEASDILDQDLWTICQYDNENILGQTQITQPILLASSVAIWRVWAELSALKPSILAGHSLGEYSALVCAGSMNYEDAINLVHKRGEFMQSASPQGKGKMAAIVGLESSQIDDICDEIKETGIVSAANLNSPVQIVIAGEAKSVDKAIELCKSNGAKRALPLNVSVPSHCALMKPASEKLKEELEGIEIKKPNIDVVQNVNGEICNDPRQIKSNLVRQMYEPVRWVDCVQLIYKAGIKNLVECGPGKVLSGLIRRIESDIQCSGSDSLENIKNAISKMAD